MKYYLFREYLGGGVALFDTRKKAIEFANKVSTKLFEVSEEGLQKEEFDIEEVELNPNFEEWWNTNG